MCKYQGHINDQKGARAERFRLAPTALAKFCYFYTYMYLRKIYSAKFQLKHLFDMLEASSLSRPQKGFVKPKPWEGAENTSSGEIDFSRPPEIFDKKRGFNLLTRKMACFSG